MAWHQAYEPFAKAYLAYVGAGHPSPLYAENILEILGVMQCHSIDDAAVQEARKHIFRLFGDECRNIVLSSANPRMV